MSKRVAATRTHEAQEQEVSYEVRSVWRVSALKPYGWQIVDVNSGALFAESTEFFRTPGLAWAAGVAALKADARKDIRQRYGMSAEPALAGYN